MIPGEIFTGLAKFQGIVSVNGFRLPIRHQELLQGFLRSFCFARIRLVPVGGQVLQLLLLDIQIRMSSSGYVNVF